MYHLFIINPLAGNGEYKRFEEILERLKKDRQDIFLEKTRYKGHLEKIIKKYEKEPVKRVYTVGGDGTFNELLNAIVKNNLSDKISLGMIPCGSGNDYIKNFTDLYDIKRIKNPESYINDILLAEVQSVDIGQMNGDYFVNILSVGFDAEVIKNSILFKRNLLVPNKSSYFLSALYTLISMKRYQCKVELDNGDIFHEFMMVSMGNGKYYGSGMKVLPYGDVSDGWMDICVVDSLDKLRFISLVRSFIKGNHEKAKEVTMRRTKQIKISSQKIIPMQFDGELRQGKEWNIKIIPRAIRLITPINYEIV